MPAQVAIDGHDVVVRMNGWDRLWALRSEVRVPLSEVTTAHAADKKQIKGRSLRLAGTEFPGRMKAGLYRGRHGAEFWLWRGGRRALVVETEGRYTRLVVETPDPEGDASRILAAR